MPASSGNTWRVRLSARDPGGLAFARAVRVTLVAPALFAIALVVFDNPTVATTAMFGSVSALVFADFGGPIPARVGAYLALGVGGAALLGLGTLVSGSTAWSVPLTFLVGAGVRFSGNIGARCAVAVSPLILAFVLGALVPAPEGAIPGRMTGWGLALIVAAIASVVILPRRSSVQIAGIAADAAVLLAKGLRSAVDSDRADDQNLRSRLEAVKAQLRLASLMPLRPSGPSARDMARRLMIDRLTRITRLLLLAPDDSPVGPSTEMRAVGEHGARCLEVSARALRGEAAPSELAAALADRDDVRARAFEGLEVAVRSREDPEIVLARIDDGFLARAVSAYTETVARNTAFLVGENLPAFDTDATDPVPDTSLRGAARRLIRFVGVHAEPSSVWFRDAVRAGIALAAAVFVARTLGVDHAFWVALGTLSVLRSSAMATGQTAVAAAVGTGIGFGLSAGVLAVVGLHRTGLWVVLVVGVFALGYLPQVAGFAAGQAAFTITVVVLFNLIEPQGWHTGLTRLQDVAIGVLVSSVVALVFWPRRLEPLVARLVGTLSASAGILLETAVRHPPPAVWRDARAETAAAEIRTRAAIVELIVQHRGRPSVTEPWIARLGVASHARSAADVVYRLPALLPGPGVGGTEIDTSLAVAAHRVAQALAPGRRPPDPPCAPIVRAETRTVALAAIAHGAREPRSVVRSLLVRDWLIATGEMVDDRP